MLGIFCFDGPLYRDINGNYCSITLTNEMFSRYLQIVDKLIIVVRTFPIKNTYVQMNMNLLDLESIQVIEAGNLNSIRGFLFKRKKFEIEVMNYLKKVDLIFARMPSMTSNITLKAASRLKKPYLVEVGGCAWDSFWNHGILGKMVAPLMYYYEKKYVGLADYSVYVTSNFLQKRYPNNGVTTNCSNVYLANVCADKLKQRINKIKKTDLNCIIIGQAVNSVDVKYKGEYLVIKAIRLLNKHGIKIKFQVAGPGDGGYLINLARKMGVEDQFELIGTLNKSEIFEWYSKIDIYIQPSKQEGLPRSVIESMSTGCPVVGSFLGGIPELIDTDCLFNPDSIDDIVSTLITMLNKDNMIEKAINNFEKAKEFLIEDIETRRRDIFVEYKNQIIYRS